jgi:hypothetical protein
VRFDVGNTVALNSGVLTISGTNGNDTFTVDARNGFSVAVNGVNYQFQTSQVSSIRIDGRAGADALLLYLGAQDDIVSTQTDRVAVVNANFRISATNINYQFIDGGAGTNTVLMNDSAGNDTFSANASQANLSGQGFSSTVANFRTVRVFSTGGYDQAEITGTVNNDLFVVDEGRSRMFTSGRTIIAEGFGYTRLNGGGGQDQANLIESSLDQEFNIRYRFAAVHGLNSSVAVSDVATINVTARSGNALLRFMDSFTDDLFVVQNANANMRTADLFACFTTGFRQIEIHSQWGVDAAHLFDTASNDTFFSSGNRTEFRSADRVVTTIGVNDVHVTSQNGGLDTATIMGTAGNDILVADQNSVAMRDSQGQFRRVIGFHRTNVDLGSGSDHALYQGSSQSETFRVRQSQTEFTTNQQTLTVKNARESRFVGGGGSDQVIFEELNLLQGLGNRATAYLNQYKVTAEDIAFLEASSVDNAMAEYDLEIVDFQYLLRGNWRPR